MQEGIPHNFQEVLFDFYSDEVSSRLLGVEPDYLPCVWTPYPNGGVWGGLSPRYSCKRVQGGRKLLSEPPTGGGLGAAPLKGFFYEKCLVKYCNFVINLDHSLCHRSDGRSYLYLMVFCPRRQPSIIYEGIVLRLCILLRDETVRERRGSYSGFVVGCIPLVCWMK